MNVIFNSTLLQQMSLQQIKMAVILAMVLMTTIFIFFIISIIRYHQKYIRIQKDLTKAEVDTLEKERQRIASDLHDSIGPLLSTVKLQINSLDTQIPDDIELVEKAGEHIDSIMTNIRSVANSLSPKILDRKGLSFALKDLALGTASIFPIEILCESENVPRFAPMCELHIYRIVQEIIHNTLKHAQAKTLRIQLYTDKQTLVLLTADDGKGFDTELMQEGGSGLGLRNIETRTNILQGSFDMQSAIGKGTKYTFEFSIPKLLETAA